MAITIIKGGKNEFTGRCPWCGCEFRYTADDVVPTIDKIDCPFCKRRLNHYGEHGTSASDPNRNPQLAAHFQNVQAAGMVK